MAIYHLTVKTFRRSSGQSATAAAAYRSGEKILDSRTGEMHDYSRKGGVVSSELVLPEKASQWAHNASELWNQAEQAEVRKNAVVAREFEVALPSELTEKQRRELAVSFAKELVKKHGFAAQVSIHKPGKEGDHRNHHAHILVTTRRLTERGFTEKTRELDERINRGPKEIVYWREKFAELQNRKLQEQQRPERVDHRTLKAQGIDREPTRHRGPSATAIERRTKEPSRLQQEHAQEQLTRANARAAQLRQEREQQERAREELLAQAREAAERERAQKAAQEKAVQERAAAERAQAQKAREELLAKAREATEKRRVEREQELKTAPKPPEPSRMPSRAVAWRGPSSKPAPEKAPSPQENIERARELEQQKQTTSQDQAQKAREELLARAKEATAKRRQELEAAAKSATEPPKAQAPAPPTKEVQAREQSPTPNTPEAKPLDVAAGMAAARERFAQMKAEQERVKAEQERIQKEKDKNRGRGGPER